MDLGHVHGLIAPFGGVDLAHINAPSKDESTGFRPGTFGLARTGARETTGAGPSARAGGSFSRPFPFDVTSTCSSSRSGVGAINSPTLSLAHVHVSETKSTLKF
jgi:hypothetical protein